MQNYVRWSGVCHIPHDDILDHAHSMLFSNATWHSKLHVLYSHPILLYQRNFILKGGIPGYKIMLPSTIGATFHALFAYLLCILINVENVNTTHSFKISGYQRPLYCIRWENRWCVSCVGSMVWNTTWKRSPQAEIVTPWLLVRISKAAFLYDPIFYTKYSRSNDPCKRLNPGRSWCQLCYNITRLWVFFTSYGIQNEMYSSHDM